MYKSTHSKNIVLVLVTCLKKLTDTPENPKFSNVHLQSINYLPAIPKVSSSTPA